MPGKQRCDDHTRRMRPRKLDRDPTDTRMDESFVITPLSQRNPPHMKLFLFLHTRFRLFIREIRRETMPFLPQTSLLREFIGIGFVKVR
ncbi:MAG: hypothetical protein RI957_125 [Verrucomicrobiota bacterium]